MPEALRIYGLELLGGHPALDFVNTLDWRGRDPEAGGPEECLVSFEALLAWAVRVGLITGSEEAALALEAGRDPEAAEAVVREAIVLRETIHVLVEVGRHGRHPPADTLDRINHWLMKAPAAPRLVANRGGYSWADRTSGIESAALLGRLAMSAGELLTSGQLNRVGCCAGPECGWLYLDTSPNRRRRWCSMEGCGNRAKAKRHYQRNRTSH